jgi:hypothetical protein
MCLEITKYTLNNKLIYKLPVISNNDKINGFTKDKIYKIEYIKLFKEHYRYVILNNWGNERFYNDIELEQKFKII